MPATAGLAVMAAPAIVKTQARIIVTLLGFAVLAAPVGAPLIRASAAWLDGLHPQSSAPAPQLRLPADQTALPALTAVTLMWDTSPGATQYHVQVWPADNDGPALDLIRGSNTSLTVPAPPAAYVLLPDMTYTWRVRASRKPAFAPAADASWGPWSAARTFRTPAPSTAGLAAVAPADGEALPVATPVLLRWSHPDPALFYWELQVSGDPRFDVAPATARSFVWWNLVHGGITDPPHSWRPPALQPGATYYWRVRPRVQGDGTPTEWGPTWRFMMVPQ